MRKTNIELDQILYEMRPLLDRKGLIGMAAARNTRVITDAIQEYASVKVDLIRKYGDEDGEGGIGIDPESDAFAEFMAEIEPYAQMSHDIDVMKVPTEKVMDDMTGAEMLALDWMLEG